MSDYKRITMKDEEYGNYVENRGSELNNPKIAFSYNGKIHGTIIDYLAELEDKIENGTLVELPQPTNKFAIVEYYGQKNKPLKIVEYRLLSYNLSTKKIEKLWYCSNTRFSIIVEDIATKPEAEAKLKELKENSNE